MALVDLLVLVDDQGLCEMEDLLVPLKVELYLAAEATEALMPPHQFLLLLPAALAS
jgi:hypothetical protein